MRRNIIGERIRSARKAKGLTQLEVAKLLGFKNRQTVSSIESGTRRVSASELLLASEKLGKPINYFTDSLQLEDDERISWRVTNVSKRKLINFEHRVGSWIAAYRTLAPQVDRTPQLLRYNIRLTKKSLYEDATKAGEHFANYYELGEIPAKSLRRVMENELDILVLMVDFEKGIRSAACRLPEMDAVLVDRHDILGQRHVNLAHQLFHILTWQTMRPEHVVDTVKISNKRGEQLANHFARAVLMPETHVKQFGSWKTLNDDDLISKLNFSATKLQVTSSALRWRLVTLKELPASRARAIPEDSLRNDGELNVEPNPSPLFSKPFVEVLGLALRKGRISARRAARLVEMTIDDLTDLMAAHGIDYKIQL